MAYEGDKAGKCIVNKIEFTFSLHKCPECGAVFAVTAFTLTDPVTDRWSGWSKTPKHCYNCGASMVDADDTQPASEEICD